MLSELLIGVSAALFLLICWSAMILELMGVVAPEIIDMSGACFASDTLACTIVELLTGLPPYASVKNSLSG